ncbi:MAG: C1 family peptidase [Candidatus Aminicenantes bacterium]|jgi:cathepsin L
MKLLKKKRGFVFVLSGALVAFMFLLPSLQAADDSRLTEADIVKMQEKINANGWTFQVGFNSACDYSLDQLVVSNPAKSTQSNALSVSDLNGENTRIIALPKYYACVSTPVENQGCSSSWAWASTDMFESVIKLRDGVTVDLSELWLLDCNPYGWDCVDGWFASDIFFRDGAVLSSNFPPGTSCSGVTISYQAQTWHFCKNGYSVAPTNSIKSAIMRYGSVACMVYVDSYFQCYTGGVFNASNQGDVNHFVTLCGWDDSYGAWILKNTWGTGWGENGYMRIAYGCHDVGWAANYLVY